MKKLTHNKPTLNRQASKSTFTASIAAVKPWMSFTSPGCRREESEEDGKLLAGKRLENVTKQKFEKRKLKGRIGSKFQKDRFWREGQLWKYLSVYRFIEYKPNMNHSTGFNDIFILRKRSRFDCFALAVGPKIFQLSHSGFDLIHVLPMTSRAKS